MRVWRGAALACLFLGFAAHAQQAAPPLDVPFVPTPDTAVAAMLKLAGVGKDDVVYDLGSGDGRIVITAARRYGARGVGIDIDPARIAEGERNARAAGVADRVRFVRQDLFDADIGDATVVTLYLLAAAQPAAAAEAARRPEARHAGRVVRLRHGGVGAGTLGRGGFERGPPLDRAAAAGVGGRHNKKAPRGALFLFASAGRYRPVWTVRISFDVSYPRSAARATRRW